MWHWSLQKALQNRNNKTNNNNTKSICSLLLTSHYFEIYLYLNFSRKLHSILVPTFQHYQYTENLLHHVSGVEPPARFMGLWPAEPLLAGLVCEPQKLNMFTGTYLTVTLPAFLHINAINMQKITLPATYIYRCWWGCITLILSPVSAPELDLIMHWQSSFCVFIATVFAS